MSKPADDFVHPSDWEFTLAGGWKQIEDPLECGPDEFMETAADRAGYSAHNNREMDRFYMVQYAARKTDVTSKYPFLVGLHIKCDLCFNIFVDSLPALVELLYRLATIDTAESLDCLAESSIEPFARKFFHAEHGHSLDGVCMECSPVETKYQLEARERREANRRLMEAAAEDNQGRE